MNCVLRQSTTAVMLGTLTYRLMRRGNNIHVQQHKTNMINKEWNKTQNDAPFVDFYDMSRLFCQIKWQMCRSRDCSGLFFYPD